MAVCLIPLAILLVALCRLGSDSPRSARDELVASGLLAGVWIVAGTELLSLVHALSFPFVLAWWGGPVAFLALVAWRRRSRTWSALRPLLRAVPDRVTGCFVGLTAIVLLITFMIAAWTPPTVWDCLAYHMPRQVFWMFQSGVQHFPTHNLRQLEMPPFAEFAGVHLLILAGSDWPANLVQWAALALAAVAASLVARDLGGKAAAQALAALMVLTLPSAVIQSLNPKNDVVLAGLALAGLRYAAAFWLGRRWTWREGAELAAACGLMLLTKGTGYIVLLPIAALAGVAMLRSLKWRALGVGAAMAVVVVGLNTGHWWRNYRALGSPLSLPESRGGFGLMNSSFGPTAVASNVIRNLALILSPPNEEARAFVFQAVRLAHDLMGISTDERETTWKESSRFGMYPIWNSNGNNPAPVHAAAYAMVLVLLGIAACRVRAPPGWPVFLVPLVVFIAFCVLLRWQSWHNRLLIPVVSISAPVLAVGVGSVWRRFEAPLALLSVAVAWSMVSVNEHKPLIGPKSVFAANQDQLLYSTQPQYKSAVEEVVAEVERRAPRTVGVILATQDNIYWLLRPFAFSSLRSTRIVPFGGTFGPPARPDLAAPDLIMTWESPERDIVFAGVRYRPVTVARPRRNDGAAIDRAVPMVLWAPE